MRGTPKTIEECKELYSEIVLGYSFCKKLDVYFKHPTESDLAIINSQRIPLSELAKSKGLLSEKEKLTLLAKRSHWTEKEESDYQIKLKALSDLEENIRKLVIKQQKEFAEKDLKNRKNELIFTASKREELIGLTVEKFVERRISDEYVLFFSFKNKQLKEKKFNEDIEMEDLRVLVNEYNDIHSGFSEATFRRISVCPFFVNMYSISSDLFHIFNKPIIDLSIYQVSLLLRAKFYKSLFENPDCQHPPEDYYDENIGKVVSFYDQQYSMLLTKRQQKTTKPIKKV